MRILPFFFLTLVSVAPSLSAEEIPFQEFQAGVAKTYYSLQKEHLSGFNCALQSALLDRKLAEGGLGDGFAKGMAKSFLGLEYTLTYNAKGVRVTCPEAGPTGNAKNDAALKEGKEKARYWLEKGLGAWFFLSCPQGMGRIAPSETPRVEKTAKGWKMSLQRGEDQAVLYFDSALTLTHADLYSKGEPPTRVGLRFMKGPKGLQLTAAQARYQGKVYKAQAEYIKTRGAFLPEKFVFHEVDAKTNKAKLLDTLTFENYQTER